MNTWKEFRKVNIIMSVFKDNYTSFFKRHGRKHKKKQGRPRIYKKKDLNNYIIK